MPGWISAALNIVGKTVGYLEEREKNRVMDEYHELLEEYNEAVNKKDNYTDIDVDLLSEKITSFLKAYGSKFEN